MNCFEIGKLKNKLVRFKNNATKQRFGDVWLRGHITAVMSHITSNDGEPYSNEGMQIEEIRNG